MKKGLIALLTIGGAAVAARKILEGDSPSLSERCCDLCEKKFDEMPDSFPPKRMFGNLSAIREQTERILELLQERESVV